MHFHNFIAIRRYILAVVSFNDLRQKVIISFGALIILTRGVNNTMITYVRVVIAMSIKRGHAA